MSTIKQELVLNKMVENAKKFELDVIKVYFEKY